MAEEAVGKLEFEEHLPRLRAYARALAQHPETAEDLVQDTLLRAWSARSQFVAGTNLGAWMLTILRHRFLDQVRTGRHLRYAGGEATNELMSGPAQDRAIQFEETARAFSRLAPEHQEVLMLVGAQGLGYAEAANTMSCPVGTVRSRLSRARSALHLALEGQGRRSLRSGARVGAKRERRTEA